MVQNSIEIGKRRKEILACIFNWKSGKRSQDMVRSPGVHITRRLQTFWLLFVISMLLQTQGVLAEMMLVACKVCCFFLHISSHLPWVKCSVCFQTWEYDQHRWSCRLGWNKHGSPSSTKLLFQKKKNSFLGERKEQSLYISRNVDTW